MQPAAMLWRGQQVLHQRWIWGSYIKWCMQVRDPPWLLYPGQTSPEVQNRGINGPTKRTCKCHPKCLTKKYTNEGIYPGFEVQGRHCQKSKTVVSVVSDREGHGHKAIVYKSHFPPLRHSVVTETPADTLANKPCLTKDWALCSLCPHGMVAARIKYWDLRTISLGCVTHCQ